MGYVDGVLQGPRVWVVLLLHRVVMHGGGVGPDGLFQVLPGGLLFRAEHDQPGAGQFQATVVPVPLPGLDEDLVLHALGVGQPQHLVGVLAFE